MTYISSMYENVQIDQLTLYLITCYLLNVYQSKELHFMLCGCVS